MMPDNDDNNDGDKIVEISERRRRRFRPFDKITSLTRPNYWVKGIIPRDGTVVVWGPPKCGKSFWTFDLVMHVALGWTYRGHRVHRGTVVYCALEGGESFCNRIEAWRQRYLTEDHDLVPFHLCAEPLNLVTEYGWLIQDLRFYLSEASRPAIVVLDTLNRALEGDENNSADMAAFIRAADAIRAVLKCTVIIIHHCGVAGSRPRGHTSLTGACDAQIAIDRGEDGLISIKVEYMKDGETSEPMACRLERVDLGNDTDGDPITSCVIAADDGAPVTKKRLTGLNKVAFDQLCELVTDDTQSEFVQNSERIPRNVRVCPEGVWRECFNKAHANPSQTSKQKAFVRASRELQSMHLIGIWDEKVWVAKHPDMPGHRPDK
jgi:AAA domain